jgi:two-component system LytT family sensor kinase
LAASLLQTTRFRTAFIIWWGCWTSLHFFVLDSAHISWQVALSDSVISNVLLAAAAILVTVTLQYYLPGQNKYSYLLCLCAVLAIIWLSLSRTLLLVVLKEGNEYSSFFSQSLLIRGATGFLIISCTALISVLWYTLQDQKEIEKRRTEADKLAKDAELNNLRQQLQPHFLFNSLNSINALVGSQPQKARTMIQQLSDFLRGTLKKEQKEWVSLEEELSHLQLYLEIEMVRFGHRLSTQVLNETTSAQLPIMLLQPIVENAIKFGLYDTMENVTITIEAKELQGHLIITVTNPFDKETTSPKGGTGFGLRSVQRRLYLLFTRTDLLQTAIHGNIFITTIKIPQP